ncbi:MAG: tRNA-queuosine alpha-mannosyltransferase domain-containing protein [Microthrixaceae bacterium]
MNALHAVLVEPYLTGSHRAWAEGWAATSHHHVTVVGHEGTAWRWRMTGAAVTTAGLLEDHARHHGTPDVLVVSDMTDLAALRGLLGPRWAAVPSVLYLHEDQLTQPVGPNGHGGDRRLAWVNWTSALAADEVWVNSDWHRRGFIDALGPFLAAVPDHPHDHLLASVAARCRVVPVGADLAGLLAADRAIRAAEPEDAPLVLWNHRWDHDKGIDRFLVSARSLEAEGVPFRLALLGEDRHHDASRWVGELAPLAGRIELRGRLDRAGYEAVLARADVVVAAARQEHFGLSVVEAVAAGCVPVVPDDCSYREVVPDPAARYPSGRLTTALRDALADLPARSAALGPLRGHVAGYDWSRVAPLADGLLADMVGRGRVERVVGP